MDTADNLKDRKGKALDAMKTLHEIFTSKFVSIQTKLKQFKMYVESVFTYSTEMWTAAATTKKTTPVELLGTNLFDGKSLSRHHTRIFGFLIH